MIHILRLALLTYIVCWTSLGIAHNRSEAFSNWLVLDKQVSARFTFASTDLVRLKRRAGEANAETQAARLIDHLLPRLKVSAAGETCAIEKQQMLNAKSGYLQFEIVFVCPRSGDMEIQYHGFFDSLPGHNHFARLKHGNELHEFVFSVQSRTWSLDQANKKQSLADYLFLGMGHLFSGWDHIAFLLALLLSAKGAKAIILIVSGFTLGHSLTLALALLTVVKTNAMIVEALIGLSILTAAFSACISTSNSGYRIQVAIALLLLSISAAVFVWYQYHIFKGALAIAGLGIFSATYISAGAIPRLQRSLFWSCAMSFVFGLVHGLGFAGFLSDKGYEEASLVKLLVGFNTGIELAQLAIVLLLSAGFILLKKLNVKRHQTKAQTMAFSVAIKTCLSSVLAGIGAYWFVLRLAV